jgi:tetratricopeptide (TPR) repeat protein
MDSTAGVSAYVALHRAAGLLQHASEKETAFIEALAKRYEAEPAADRAHLDLAYANAMRGVAARYPEDLEAVTLLAESLMDLTPWNYWNEDKSPGPNTSELLGHLERVLAANPDHPGANHLYIHAVEAVDPQRAVEEAERLAGLMPGAGHIVHMPGHIYVRVGRYRDAIMANEHAVHADETYIQDHSPAVGVYVGGYYPHNYDFLAFAASMIGREQQSIEAAEKLQDLAPEKLLRVPGMTFLQAHRTRHLQMKVRFSKWDEILQVSQPAQDLWHERAIWHYARGRALAASEGLPEARAEFKQLSAIAGSKEVENLRLEFNRSADILRIATRVLAGQLAAAEGDRASAADHLREAVRLEDGLVYGEPPEWSVPVRQELGRILLEAGLPGEAEEIFRDDLVRFPDNGWSLYGLATALEAQGKDAQSKASRDRQDEMWDGSSPPW